MVWAVLRRLLRLAPSSSAPTEIAAGHYNPCGASGGWSPVVGGRWPVACDSGHQQWVAVGDVAEQSGHIATVGYEMYCRLLENAVKQMKNEAVEPAPAETIIDFGVSGMIPAAYIPSIKRRIEAYRRLATARSLDDLANIERDIEQAYGKLPRAADRLLQLAELRILASALTIHSIKIDGPDVVIRCDDYRAVQAALERAKGTVRLVAPKHPGAGAEVYFRPPPKHLAPLSLLTILRARLKPVEPPGA